MPAARHPGDKALSAASRPGAQPARWAPAGLALLGVAVVLLSQFALDGWAGISRFGDWVQHGLIFWGGLALAVGLRLALGGSRGRVAGWAALCVLGAAVAVGCEFALDPWAGVSLVGDSVQHGVIFAGGLAVGAACTSLHLLGRRRP